MKSVAKNPTKARIAELIKASAHTAAKWLKDSSSGDMYYWPAEKHQHADVAKHFGVSDYTKGIAVAD